MNRSITIAARLLVLMVVFPLGPSAARAQTTRPIPQVKRVLIISVDGMRPDLMLRARTPNLHALFRSGCFSFWALTIPSANTLPSHVAMLTGVGTEKHGIDFNDERATTRPFYPKVPTIFQLAKQRGLTTAMVSGKSKFHALGRPGSVDWLSAPEDPKSNDADVADRAGAILRLHRPDVMFVHFPGPDSAGHSKGWGSDEQIASFEQVDEHIGMLLNALQTSGLSEETAVIVSADHGGSARTHGAKQLYSRNIPWIIAGPGVRKNFDLTLLKDVQINTTDTFATACFLLGIELPPDIDGKPVYQIVEGYELLHDAKPATAPTTAPR